jgi:hypothetical protein
MTSYPDMKELWIVISVVSAVHQVQVPVEGGRVVDEAVVAEGAAEPAHDHAQQVAPRSREEK